MAKYEKNERSERQSFVLSQDLFNIHRKATLSEQEVWAGGFIIDGHLNLSNKGYEDDTGMRADRVINLQDLLDKVARESGMRGLSIRG